MPQLGCWIFLSREGAQGFAVSSGCAAFSAQTGSFRWCLHESIAARFLGGLGKKELGTLRGTHVPHFGNLWEGGEESMETKRPHGYLSPNKGAIGPPTGVLMNWVICGLPTVESEAALKTDGRVVLVRCASCARIIVESGLCQRLRTGPRVRPRNKCFETGLQALQGYQRTHWGMLDVLCPGLVRALPPVQVLFAHKAASIVQGPVNRVGIKTGLRQRLWRGPVRARMGPLFKGR